MAEKQEKKTDKKQEKQEKPEVKRKPQEDISETLVRILSYDIPGSRNIYAGLTRIKGVSWSISNFVCLKLGLKKTDEIQSLSKEQIKKIEDFIKSLPVPDYMKNRRSDPVTGASSHLHGTDLDIARDFDIKRMKKMKSYKGVRHASKLPVRGQRTRSHFRTRSKAGTGIKKQVSKPAGAVK